MERYDVIVIGTGPAGLSAAVTLKIRNKSVLVIGNSKISHKVFKAHEINNYLGIPKITGTELADKFMSHAKEMGIEIAVDQILAVYPMGDYFSLSTKENKIYEARTVIISVGVNFGKPYKGEEQYLGQGVSYCATCDAPLYKGKKVIIIGSSPKEEDEAKFMAELVGELIYIPLYRDDTRLPENVRIVRDIPLEIKGKLKADTLVLKEQEISADGIFILRDSVLPSQLVYGLEVENNHILVNRKMETSVPGCFACGDIVGAPYQYIKAAGEGNIAALSAVEYLATKQ